VTRFLAIAGQHHVQPGFALANGRKHRQQLLADRTGRRQEEDQGVFRRNRTDLHQAAGQARQVEGGRHLAQLRPAVIDHGADGRDTFEQDADLAGQGEDHDDQCQDQHSEHTDGEDK